MKLKDALAQLDRTKYDTERGDHHWNKVSWETLTDAANLQLSNWDFADDSWGSDKVKDYPIKTWICTDTEVGLVAYYFEDELLMISMQTGRKNNVHFYFASPEMRTKLITHILENVDKNKTQEAFNPIDLEMEIDRFPEDYWGMY